MQPERLISDGCLTIANWIVFWGVASHRPTFGTGLWNAHAADFLDLARSLKTYPLLDWETDAPCWMSVTYGLFVEPLPEHQRRALNSLRGGLSGMCKSSLISHSKRASNLSCLSSSRLVFDTRISS